MPVSLKYYTQIIPKSADKVNTADCTILRNVKKTVATFSFASYKKMQGHKRRYYDGREKSTE